MADLTSKISDFVWKNIDEKQVHGIKDPFWESLCDTGQSFGSIRVIWMKRRQLVCGNECAYHQQHPSQQ